MFRFQCDEVLSIFIKNNYYDELKSISELFISMLTETRRRETFVVIDNNISQSGYSKRSRNPVHMHLFHSKVHQTHHRNKSNYGCSPEEVYKAKSELVSFKFMLLI